MNPTVPDGWVPRKILFPYSSDEDGNEEAQQGSKGRSACSGHVTKTSERLG